MNYKEEIINALADVCKRARREGYAEGLKRGEDIDHKDIENVKKKAYEQGIAKMWKCVRFLHAPVSEGGLTSKQLLRIFGSKSIGYIISTFSAEEIVERIEAYEKAQNVVNKTHTYSRPERLCMDCEYGDLAIDESPCVECFLDNKKPNFEEGKK